MKVLITDDSKVIRNKVRVALQSMGEFTFCEADSGESAITALKDNRDIKALILDINMPGIDGITTMQFVNDKFKVPCIIYSSFTKKNLNLTYEAVELGAYDVVHKPHGISNYSFTESIDRIKSSLDKIRTHKSIKHHSLRGIIVIGMSTGGPKTFRKILPDIRPMPYHSIIIVQHMPESFIPSFAKSMNSYSQINCELAEDHAEILANKVYLAPGGKNLLFEQDSNALRFKLEVPKEHQPFTPMIDETFISASKVFGRNTLSVVLTGMGADGARGAGKIKQSGGKVVVESEESSIVYGMPKATKELVAIDGEYGSSKIAQIINNYTSEKDMAA